MEPSDIELLKFTKVAHAIMNFKGLQIKQLAAKAELAPPNLSVWFKGERKNVLSYERVGRLFRILGFGFFNYHENLMLNSKQLHQWNIPEKYSKSPFSDDLTAVLDCLRANLDATPSTTLYVFEGHISGMLLKLATSDGTVYIHITAEFDIKSLIGKPLESEVISVSVGQAVKSEVGIIDSMAAALGKHLSEDSLVDFKKLNLSDSGQFETPDLIKILNENDFEEAYEAMSNFVVNNKYLYGKVKEILYSPIKQDTQLQILKEWQVEFAKIKNYADRCHMQLYKIEQLIHGS
ncbi:MAG: hypothetical protein LWW76_09030 [Burkholderiales bacterium]|jgi:hypothetical protein|nr:hypothetical protein [Acinetobacter sp.]MCE1177243.1 hypothetical protein [Burkholderiales bacterium]